MSGYYFDRQYNEYTEERIGARVTLGRKLGNLFDWQEAQYWTVTVGGRLENVNVSNIAAPPAPYLTPPVDFTSVQGNNFLVALRVARPATPATRSCGRPRAVSSMSRMNRWAAITLTRW